MSAIRVFRKLTDEERCDVTDLLTEAFSDHILMVNVLAGDATLMRPMVEAFVRMAEAQGEIHVIGTPRMEGVALWCPPGSEFEPTAESGWFDVQANVPPDVAAWGAAMIVDEWKLAAELFGDSAHKDAWHLSMIGVRPELQRRGFGTQLMQFVVAKADEARAMMLVETTKFAIGFYERNGLVDSGHVHVQSPRGPEWDQILMARVPPT